MARTAGLRDSAGGERVSPEISGDGGSGGDGRRPGRMREEVLWRGRDGGWRKEDGDVGME